MFHSNRSQEGYLRIDNKLAPPPDEAHMADVAALEARGCYVITPPVGAVFEGATLTCSHCHVTFLKNPQRQRERRHCSKCDHYICDSVACNSDIAHMPMAKLIDLVRNDAAKAEDAIRQGR
jgi:hypothetical protein